MIVSNHQQNIFYYKEYPCYSLTTHLSAHRQMEFANVTLVQFSNQTSPKRDLPKYFIDKYQSPHKMYWLEWRMEELTPAVIEEGKKRINQLYYENQSNNNKSSHMSTQSLKKKHYRCLYIAQLGEVAHIKLVFNYDPEIVGICQDFIYTVGGNQLIITELWPQNIQSSKNINSATQFPPNQSQIVHKLDPYNKVLSLDFVQDEQKNIVCKIIYFNEKKGIYAQIYKKDQPSQSSLFNKIIDFSLKFKKNESQPLYYQTLVPNILGIVIQNAKEFMLFNLAQMKPIVNTKMSLQGWQLNHYQPILISTRQNETVNNFNDCLTIAIGQGTNIEIFLYHIRYSSTATLYLPQEDNTKPTNELKKWPIHMFTSGEFIDFESSILKHLTIVHLQKVSYLSNFILSKSTLVYLGYEKGVNVNSNATSTITSQQLPIAGIIKYDSPYITHEILMQENKIWRQYKIDMLMGINENNKKNYEENLQRLLIPGRYDISFILKTLKLNKITDLSHLMEQKHLSMKEINQRLLFEWRNEYKFVEFVTFREQFLIIRKNSIGTLIDITFEQFLSSKDKSSQIEISYNKLLSRGFDTKFDIEGDMYIEQENNEVYQNMIETILDKSVRCYEDKMRTINGRIKDFMAEKDMLMGDEREESMPVGEYYDEEQYKRYSRLYESTLYKIHNLAKQSSLTPLPQRSFINNNTNSNMNISVQHQQLYYPSSSSLITQSKHILLHASILSLRVKDQLIYLIDTLKMNYQYYFEQLVRQMREQQSQYVRQSHKKGRKLLTNENRTSTKITSQMLHHVHQQHIYTVYILQWINSIATKTHLQQQYEYFNNDLIQEFINFYVVNHCKGSFIEQNGTILSTDYRLFKADIETHVMNVFCLLFRGLVRGIDCTGETGGIVEFAREVQELSQQEIISSKISKINKQASPLIMLLLKKHNEITKHFGGDNNNNSSNSKFIVQGLLMTLMSPLILQPQNQPLSTLMPVTKTFIYTILQLPIARQQKQRILSLHLHRPQYLSLLLLIQQENNCYLMIEQGLQVEIYENDVELFVRSTVGLGKVQCCLLEEVILLNYKAFLMLLPQKQNLQQTKNKMMMRQQQQLFTAIDTTDPQLQKQLQQKDKQISIQFVKLLFSNIDFMHLTYVITRPYANKQQFVENYQHYQHYQQYQHQGYAKSKYINNKVDQKLLAMYQNKPIAYVYRQLIQQVEKINENYGLTKATPIERTLKKFFNKIYHPKINNKSQQRHSRSSYPEFTGLDYHLSTQQLQVIQKLYQKHLKLLKLDKKQTFQSTSIIQQRLNLQYSMIKILMFRLNLALRQISTLTQEDKLKYVQVIRKCIQGLKQAINSFKYWRLKLTGQKREISDQQCLDILIQTDQMENSLVWNEHDEDVDYYYNHSIVNNDQDTTEQSNQYGDVNKKWLIMGTYLLSIFKIDIPLSSEWLQLLLLTFSQSNIYYQHRQASSLLQNKPSEIKFTNYHSLQSVLMKMLIVIKRDRLVKQYQVLNRLFGEEKVNQIIEGNQMLKNMYIDGVESAYKEEVFTNKFGKYTMANYGGLFGGSNLNAYNN